MLERADYILFNSKKKSSELMRCLLEKGITYKVLVSKLYHFNDSERHDIVTLIQRFLRARDLVDRDSLHEVVKKLFPDTRFITFNSQEDGEREEVNIFKVISISDVSSIFPKDAEKPGLVIKFTVPKNSQNSLVFDKVIVVHIDDEEIYDDLDTIDKFIDDINLPEELMNELNVTNFNQRIQLGLIRYFYDLASEVWRMSPQAQRGTQIYAAFSSKKFDFNAQVHRSLLIPDPKRIFARFKKIKHQQEMAENLFHLCLYLKEKDCIDQFKIHLEKIFKEILPVDSLSGVMKDFLEILKVAEELVVFYRNRLLEKLPFGKLEKPEGSNAINAYYETLNQLYIDQLVEHSKIEADIFLYDAKIVLMEEEAGELQSQIDRTSDNNKLETLRECKMKIKKYLYLRAELETKKQLSQIKANCFLAVGDINFSQNAEEVSNSSLQNFVGAILRLIGLRFKRTIYFNVESVDCSFWQYSTKIAELILGQNILQNANDRDACKLLSKGEHPYAQDVLKKLGSNLNKHLSWEEYYLLISDVDLAAPALCTLEKVGHVKEEMAKKEEKIAETLSTSRNKLTEKELELFCSIAGKCLALGYNAKLQKKHALWGEYRPGYNEARPETLEGYAQRHLISLGYAKEASIDPHSGSISAVGYKRVRSKEALNETSKVEEDSSHIKIISEFLQTDSQSFLSADMVTLNKLFSKASRNLLLGDISLDGASWNLPQQEILFLGRENYLSEIKENLKLKNGSQLALVGEQGVGKSAIAVEYARQRLKDQKYNFVLWLDGSSSLSLLRDFWRFSIVALQENALGFEYAIKKVPVEQLIELVCSRLESFSKVLIVFDDLQDNSLYQYFLESKKYSTQFDVLVTATNLFFKNDSSISISRLNESHAVKLIQSALKGETDQKAACLARKLEFFPLALTQAILFCNHFKISIDQYLSMLDESCSEEPFSSTSICSSKSDKAIFHNLSMIINRLKNPLSVKILDICSYLAENNILKKFLILFLQENVASIDAALLELESCGLINIGKERSDEEFQCISINKLVQNAYLALNRTEKVTLKKYLSGEPISISLQDVAAIFLYKISSFKNQLQFYYLTYVLGPHVECLYQKLARNESKDNGAIENVMILGSYLLKILIRAYELLDAHDKLIELLNRQLLIQEIALQEEKDQIVETLLNLARVYNKTKKFEKALAYVERAYSINIKLNNQESMFETLALRVDIYMALEKYQEALSTANYVCHMGDKLYKPNDIRLVFSYLALGNINREIKRYEEAIENLTRAEKLIENYHSGMYEFEKVNILYNLALTLVAQGKMLEAIERLFTANNILDSNSFPHGNQLDMQKNINQMLVSLGVKEHSPLLLQYRIRKIQEELEKDPTRVQLYIDLAGLYYKQDNLTLTIDAYEKALKAHEEFPDRHVNIELANHNLACCYHALGRIKNQNDKIEKAREYFLRAIKLDAVSKIKDAGVYCEYGLLLFNEEKYDEAISQLNLAVSYDDDNDDFTLYYGLPEKILLDDYLQVEVTRDHILEISPKLFASYLLIQCYHKLKEDGKIGELIDEITKYAENKKLPLAYKILAHVYEVLGDPEKYKESLNKTLITAIESSSSSAGELTPISDNRAAIFGVRVSSKNDLAALNSVAASKIRK